MYRLGALALLGAQAAYAAPASKAERASGMTVSENTAIMKPINVKPGSSKAILAKTGSETLGLVEDDAGYAVETTLNGKTYDLIFDTGSSDLWVFDSGVECLNSNGKPAAAKTCAFGPEYSGTYAGGTIPDKNLYITYGDDEFVEGSLGYDPVTIAGVSVTKQEMSLVEKAYFVGDGVVSGIVGFAYDHLDSQYPGQPPKTDNADTVEHYSNFFHSAVKEGKTNSLFTVILKRPGAGSSSVTLGGVPSSVASLDYTSTPIEIKNLGAGIPGAATHHTYYIITPEGYEIDGEKTSASFNGIVDTGTTLLYLPNADATAINLAFDPPSVYDATEGVYLNDCDATPPKFGLTIGGKTFYISNHELLLQGKLGSVGDGLCVVGVQPVGSEDFAILGDVFLKNVVAVFDQGDAEMKFAAHETY